MTKFDKVPPGTTYSSWLRRCAHAYSKAIRHYAAMNLPLPPAPTMDVPKGCET